MFLEQSKAVKLELPCAQYDYMKVHKSHEPKFQINNQILGSVNISFTYMLPMKELWLQMPSRWCLGQIGIRVVKQCLWHQIGKSDLSSAI